MCRLTKIVSLLLLLAVSIGCSKEDASYADDAYAVEIYGTVLDQTYGTPIDYVFVICTTPERSDTVLTGADGAYRFRYPFMDECTCTIKAIDTAEDRDYKCASDYTIYVDYSSPAYDPFEKVLYINQPVYMECHSTFKD